MFHPPTLVAAAFPPVGLSFQKRDTVRAGGEVHGHSGREGGNGDRDGGGGSSYGERRCSSGLVAVGVLCLTGLHLDIRLLEEKDELGQGGALLPVADLQLERGGETGP